MFTSKRLDQNILSIQANHFGILGEGSLKKAGRLQQGRGPEIVYLSDDPSQWLRGIYIVYQLAD